MEISLTNIKYNWGICHVSCGNITKIEQELQGYEVSFLINKILESKINIGTDRELSIEEIKAKILETLTINQTAK